jgi:hypothetical protein
MSKLSFIHPYPIKPSHNIMGKSRGLLLEQPIVELYYRIVTHLGQLIVELNSQGSSL